MRSFLGLLVLLAIIYLIFPGFFLFALVGGIFHLLFMFFIAWLVIKVLIAVFSIAAALILFPVILVAGLLIFPVLLPFAVIYLICLAIGALAGKSRVKSS